MAKNKAVVVVVVGKKEKFKQLFRSLGDLSEEKNMFLFFNFTADAASPVARHTTNQTHHSVLIHRASGTASFPHRPTTKMTRTFFSLNPTKIDHFHHLNTRHTFSHAVDGRKGNDSDGDLTEGNRRVAGHD